MQKLKSLILFFFIFLSSFLVISISFVDNVKATNYSIGFEDTDVGNQFYSGFMYTKERDVSGFFDVTNNVTYSGYRAFRVLFEGGVGGGRGFYNFTYPSNKMINKFECYVNFVAGTDGNGLDWAFSIDEWQTASDWIIGFNGQRDGGQINLSYFANGYYNLIQLLNFDTWYKVGFEFYDNDTVKYYTNESVRYDNFYQNLDNKRIVCLNSYAVPATQGGHYVDDILFSTVDYNFTGVSGCSDFSGYDWVGNGFTNGDGNYRILSGNYMEFGTSFPINATMIGLELLLDNNQLLYVNQEANSYYCYVNDNLAGYGTCFKNYGTDAILQFDFQNEIQIENEPLVIELYNSILSSSGVGWYYMGQSYSDDSIQDLVYYGSTERIDGILNGDHYNLYGALWKIFYDEFSATTPSTCGENAIGLLGFNAKHPTYNIPFSYCRHTIFFDVTVNQTELPYKLHVYRDDVEVGQTLNFPRTLYNCQETIGYTAYNSGNYNVTIETSGGNEYVRRNFYIENLSEEYNIWSNPNPSYSNQPYDIYVWIDDNNKYDNYRIGVFDGESGNYNDIDDAFGDVLITPTGSNISFAFSFTHERGDIFKHVLRLFADVGNNQWLPLNIYHDHFVKVYTYGSGDYNLDIVPNEVIENQNFKVLGFNHIVGKNVYIYFGSEKFADVTNDASFSYDYSIATKGTYAFYLKRDDNGTLTTIDTVLVYVYEDTIGGQPSLFPPVSEVIGAILGVVIVLLFLFLPLVIPLSLSYHTDIPSVVYVFSGSLGIVLSIALGFFEIWVIFFILVLAVVYLIITWWQRGS